MEDIPYAGIPVDGELVVDCADADKDVFLSVGVRLIDDVVTGYVGPPVRVSCQEAGFLFAEFDVQVAVLGFGESNQDSFRLIASYTLDAASDGTDPASEPFRLSVGDYELELAPGSLDCGPSLCEFADDHIEIALDDRSLIVRLQDVSVGDTSNEVAVGLSIGNDATTVELELTGNLTLPAR